MHGGSHSQELDNIAQELWEWSIQREIWISAVHIPGIPNVDADDQSRNYILKFFCGISGMIFGRFYVMILSKPILRAFLVLDFARKSFGKWSQITFLKIGPLKSCLLQSVVRMAFLVVQIQRYQVLKR